MIQAKLHDGQMIDVEIQGEGPNLLLPVNPHPIEGPQADEMVQWGVDPTLGRSLIDGLRDKFRVIAFDYEGHVLRAAKPDTLTPANISSDLLSIADAASAPQFAYYGYSWLALSGMQLAIRSQRLSALVMGGFPPIDGPYQEMLSVTRATHEMSCSASNSPNSSRSAAEEFDWSTVEVSMSEAQTKQFVTLYQHLQGFNDRSAQSEITCPRLCFAGTADKIDYSKRWGDVQVDIAGPLMRSRSEIEALGWDVEVLEGLNHTQAMQAVHVLPILRPWLESTLTGRENAHLISDSAADV
ncbi:alpha/beta hydrolase [Paenibacillus sp. UMB4589-SE434]|uniref:alpha/beta fold hydrolase n=1 Tax=Paenibacillus sp. UMB4589-SE434 TaxID=3046314 RepID=UPI00254A0981|nr:alpha/beta hydrolase [Paenibacillus sp. UMB4589-SE434]MDK8181314.1 alpha/beta hydrolase [Paenibacillus sp. UMB4589-SE434]